MRLSQMFFQTLREAPTDAELASQKCLLRASYLYASSAGHYTPLPLGQKALANLETRLQDGLVALGAQQIGPGSLPAALGRRFAENAGGKKAAALASSVIRSYKQLPQVLYRFTPVWNANPRPRQGWFGQQQGTALEVFLYAANEAGLKSIQPTVRSVIEKLIGSLNVPIETLNGALDDRTVEWFHLHPAGSEIVLACPACGYRAVLKNTRFLKPPALEEALVPLEPVATPQAKTIDDLCAFLKIPQAKTAKAVFLTATLDTDGGLEERFVFAVVRGDMDVDEHKLARLIAAVDMRPASEDEIRAVGAVPGYASPVGLKNVLVVVDEAALSSPNLVAGANREGYHLLNVNAGRDYAYTLSADICLASPGDGCSQCGKPLQAFPAVKLGSLASADGGQKAIYLGDDGKEHPIQMAWLRLDLEKLLACCVEVNHDDGGIRWPLAAAPYRVHLVGLNGAEDLAESLYDRLSAAGLDVLYDDRPESPGVKFNDADLMGIPFRLTAGKRALKENAVEYKLRTTGESGLIGLDRVVEEVKQKLAALERPQ